MNLSNSTQANESKPSLWKVMRGAVPALNSAQPSVLADARRSFSLRIRKPFARFFTTKDVARMLAYSEKQVRRLCATGKIGAVKSSSRGQYRIGLNALRELTQKNPEYWNANADSELMQLLSEPDAENSDDLAEGPENDRD